MILRTALGLFDVKLGVLQFSSFTRKSTKFPKQMRWMPDDYMLGNNCVTHSALH